MTEKTGEISNSPTRSESALGARLSSWKEIGRFLKADVRTCQRWEQSSGLPVHRIQNAVRSRVYAWPRELEEWQKRAFGVGGAPAKNGTARPLAGAEPASAGGNATKAVARRSFRLRRLVLLTIPVLAVAAAAFVFLSADRNPTGFKIRGSSLVILNKSGRELWTHDTKLTRFQDEAFYRFSFSGKAYATFKTGDLPRAPFLIIRDIDGNDRNEVLFVPQTKGDLGAGGLHLFDSRGNVKWIFKSGREIQIGDRKYSPDYVIEHVEVLDFNADSRPEIMVIAHAYHDAPTQVILLDLEKKILGEYWNFGRVYDYSCADLNGDRRPEIILAGVNNGHGCPCLAVLDPRDMSGASPQDAPMLFSGISEGSERFYIRFANTDLDKIIEPRAWFHQIRTMSNGHILAETGVSFIRYDFDAELNPPQIRQADRGKRAYLDAVLNGKISRRLNEETLRAELAAGIRYYDGASKTWVNRRAMSNPWPAKK